MERSGGYQTFIDWETCFFIESRELASNQATLFGVAISFLICTNVLAEVPDRERPLQKIPQQQVLMQDGSPLEGPTLDGLPPDWSPDDGPPPVPPNVTSNVEFAHPPYAQGVCNICHVRSNPADAGPAKKSQSDICFSCHIELLNSMTSAKNVHKPFLDNCQYCHNPHNADRPNLLISDEHKLCISCHKPVGAEIKSVKVTHGALTRRNSCANCHDPHGGNINKLLRSQPYDLCVQCHGIDVFKDKNGKKLKNIKEHFAQNSNRHAPVENRECSTCHRPHGSNNHRLLIRGFPATFYAKYSRDKYSLCYECHPDKIIEARESEFTGFRKEKKNFHYRHVIQEQRGRSCRACHAVHASSQSFHIRESVPFGTSDWELPLNFSESPMGGSCQKTCHEMRVYDRGGEEFASDIKVPKWNVQNLDNESISLLDEANITVLVFFRPDQNYSRLVLSQLEDCRAGLSQLPVRLLGVVSDHYSQSAIKKALNSSESELEVIIDRGSRLAAKIGVKVHPLLAIVDRNHTLTKKQTISKANMCVPLTKRVQFALGGMSVEALEQTLVSPKLEIDEQSALVARYIGLATLLLKGKNYKKAQEAIGLALKHDPSSGAAQAILRVVLTAQGDRPQLEVQRAKGPVVIDGSLDEFAKAQSLAIKAGGAKASFRMLWDERALYVAARVTDQDLWDHPRERTDTSPKADGFEILLDPLHNQTETIDEDDHHYEMTASGNVYRIPGDGQPADLVSNSEIKYAAIVRGTMKQVDSDTGYDAEISIPWSSASTRPWVGKLLGVNLAVNDADEAGVVSANWAGLGGYLTPSSWNELVIVSGTERKDSQENSAPDASTTGKPKAAMTETTREKDHILQGMGCGCRVADGSRQRGLTTVLFGLLAFTAFLIRSRRRK